MAAENGDGSARRAGAMQASMRPRRMAAENAWSIFHLRPDNHRFNEAAAHGRGKRAARGQRAASSDSLQ